MKKKLFVLAFIFILVLVQIALSYVTLKNSKIRDFIDGKAKVIINNGKVDFKQMQKLRYSLDDLISQLREQQVKNIMDVKDAILENNGKLSIFTDDSIYPMPVILDGIIDYSTLKNMKKDKSWIDKLLKDNHVSLSEVFYLFYTKDKTYIIKKQ